MKANTHRHNTLFAALVLVILIVLPGCRPEATQLPSGLLETVTAQAMTLQAVNLPANGPAETPAPPTCVQNASFVEETYPDGSVLLPGTSFLKTWTIRNAGDCVWTTETMFEFYAGDQMEAETAIPLPQEVQPGQTVVIAVNMVAPQEPGTYRGDWIFREPDGATFGWGPQADEAFWVEIKVDTKPTPTGGGGGTIAYLSQTQVGEALIYNVYLIDPSGNNVRQLTSNTSPDDWTFPYEWSPDGRYLIVHLNASFFIQPVSDGAEITHLPVSPVSSVVDLYATWSPDGESIAFTSNRGMNTGSSLDDLFLFTPGTGELLQLTQMQSGTVFYDVDFSPDGQEIAFVVHHNNNWRTTFLYLINADGSNLRLLAETCNSGYYSVQYSPDGEYLAFTSNCANATGLFRIRPDGSDLQQLNNRQSTAPVWSPDGMQIVYYSWSTKNDLYITNADGSSELLLAPSLSASEPAWSPDGQWIAFRAGNSASETELYIIRPDGSGLRQLTDNEVVDVIPVWQP